MKGDQVGIAIFAVGDVIEFHAVDEAGETVSVNTVAPDELRQATWLEIPERRRPSAAVAAGLGYEVAA